MKKTVLREYAKLIVRSGVNVQKGQEVMIYAGLDQPEFVQMVVRLLPKENLDNSDLEGDVLSLQKCISALPSMEDVTAELNRMKDEYAKLEARWKTARSLQWKPF